MLVGIFMCVSVSVYEYNMRILLPFLHLFLLSKMLSPQRHYDWGLRELKTVLTACGKVLRESSDLISSQQETELAVQALRLNTMSKLTLSDCKRYDFSDFHFD